MPWKLDIFNAVCTGLRAAAKRGEFVPNDWITSIEDDGAGGCHVMGCGEGHIGWYAAVAHRGVDWARRMLPVGSRHEQVCSVLKHVGLTEAEIKAMNFPAAWLHFDDALFDAYDFRYEDPDSYIAVSMELAEFFIGVIERVEVVDEGDLVYEPFAVMSSCVEPELSFLAPHYADAGSAKPPLFLLTQQGIGTQPAALAA